MSTCQGGGLLSSSIQYAAVFDWHSMLNKFIQVLAMQS